jgi:hypothetical protein
MDLIAVDDTTEKLDALMLDAARTADFR